jgi:hypothetical protein
MTSGWARESLRKIKQQEKRARRETRLQSKKRAVAVTYDEKGKPVVRETGE